MKNKKENPMQKVLNEIISNKKEKENMYSKIDLIENEKMNEIIRKNRERIRKQVKVEKKESFKDKVLMFIASGILMFGLMYFIAVVESLRF